MIVGRLDMRWYGDGWLARAVLFGEGRKGVASEIF